MKTKYFELIYDKSDEAFAQKLAHKADKVYEEMISRFGFDSPAEDRKILLTICDNVSLYIEVTNKTEEEYQEWMVGNCDFENRKITILSPRIATVHSEEEIEKVFVHETIHMIFDINAGGTDAPAWCAEGIAILYAGQIEPEYIDDSDHPKSDQLLDEETFAERGGYDYAGVYVRHFIQQYGFDRFLELYKNAPGAAELIYNGFEEEAIRSVIHSS